MTEVYFRAPNNKGKWHPTSQDLISSLMLFGANYDLRWEENGETVVRKADNAN